MKYHKKFKIHVFYFNIFLIEMYSFDGEAEFPAVITPVFTVNQCNISNLCARNIYYYCCFNITVETVILFSGFFDE